MPVKRAFYVEDFGEVLRTMPELFNGADFYRSVMATMPPKGPKGEDTTAQEYKDKVVTAVGNWLGRRRKNGSLIVAKRKGRAITYKNPEKEQPAAPKKPTKASEAPQDDLTVLDIGKAIEALISDLRAQKDHWQKQYYDLLREHEGLKGELRDVKVDKENLNRRLGNQNAEIQRLSREAPTQKSVVSMREVVRFKTKKRRKA